MQTLIKVIILCMFCCYCAIFSCYAQSDIKNVNHINLKAGVIIVDKVVINDKIIVSIFLAKSTSDNSSTNFDNVHGFAKQIHSFYEAQTKKDIKINNALKGWDCWLGESGITIYDKKINLRVHLDVDQAKHLADLILGSELHKPNDSLERTKPLGD